jgi:SAM-dependent methyltransferase
MSEEWFREWFASPYYNLLYGDRRDDQEASRFITCLTDFLRPCPDAKFLDAPCGTGRHVQCLASEGFETTGIDLSRPAIRTAQSCAKKAEFHVHDMRHAFREHRYDYVLNLFTSFGYFDEEGDVSTLRAFGNALAPGGRIVLDFLNTYRAVQCLRSHDECVVAGITFEIQRSVECGTIVKTIDVRDGGRSFRFAERVRAISAEDFSQYFSAAGLEIVNIFGNYQLGEYSRNDSERLVVVGRKGGL